MRSNGTRQTWVMVGTMLWLALAGCGGGGSGGTGNDPGGGTGGGGNGGGSTTPLPTQTDSSQTAYVTPTATGWQVVPLLTVGDKPAGAASAMVGKPDGLGATAGRVSATGEVLVDNRYLTVFMNHELPAARGAVRSHGTAGSFVSEWIVDLTTLRIAEGRDLISRVFAYADGAWSDATGLVRFDRLCSADLPPRTALFNSQSGNGFDGLIFLSGEEADTEGRAFANVITGSESGNSYEIPYLGKLAHENVLVHPNTGDTTLAVTLDDSAQGQVYVYVGTKRNQGNPVERAGLQGGRLYAVKVVDGGVNYSSGPVARENNGPINGRFELVDVTNSALGSGSTLQTASVSAGATEFARPEDGHWDAVNSGAFYFAVTGATIDGRLQSARLYRLTFDALDQPTAGTIDLVVDSANVTGADGAMAHGFDNITVEAGSGRVIVQEDSGDSDYIAKIWQIDPANGTASQLFESDRARFLPGGVNFLTNAEEHSGVVEITDHVRNASWYETGRRYYLGTTQAHYPLDSTLVEGGQLYLLVSPK
jgi:hypothetical protein